MYKFVVISHIEREREREKERERERSNQNFARIIGYTKSRSVRHWT